ncbi:Mrp/NBP35 family ATP-binding protein [Clavibacter michiganensis]|uniref:Iron-sulfur cluster carrier protein n=1 Tax=Clavibacter michiganensis subsp. michiganensis (strain NCPPB 382) TaxID=443906 RepID=A5CQ76_CLAM3|nr:P-loop NTPase [Clavibacter michiganensis]MBE3077635.1 Mrp/NBP35 family ATP-binding protein [Clavibacter michiganensis subsp. michiganensis]MDO4025499.1 P-loop NTPase [Clavibacter michiganensis]MDO4035327.1 P-loop NTPase [Clavibacter michiganensis]MDO4047491.1 P-loop NTPase [Clavibacter michiganensis]MDO4064843.1 P-loop NTPase [Clavibacter michiganensis]
MPAEAGGSGALTADAVRRALARVVDPEIRRPITELDMVSDVRVEADGVAHVDIALTIVGCPAATSIERDVRETVEAVPGVARLELTVGVMSPERRRALTERLRGPAAQRGIPFGPDSLTRVYAVTSGKGGVGKSTLTANLAVALAAKGLAVGLVDADVHGFSIPGILGLVDADGRTAQPTRVGDMILPPVAHGVKVISIGMFLDPDATGGTAVSWRGPMLHRTIQQFLTDVFFGDLDVLLLDLPPGTGDVAITVGQLLPNAEVLVVTTPQPAAADVAERSGLVARQTGQRVAGVVENMAGFAQPDGSVLELFGAGGGEEVARRLSAGQDEPVPLLASVPLSMSLREGGDAGAPLVLAAPEDPAAVQILRVADHLASRGRGLAGRRLGLSVS